MLAFAHISNNRYRRLNTFLYEPAHHQRKRMGFRENRIQQVVYMGSYDILKREKLLIEI